MPLSSIFNLNVTILKIFGVWPTKRFPFAYKAYSFIYIFLTIFIYFFLLTLNLFYTPIQFEMVIREYIFYFTEIAALYKALKVLSLHRMFLHVFELLECDDFKPDDETGKNILTQHCGYITTYMKVLIYSSNLDYFVLIIFTIFNHLIFGTELELQVCKYYFLSDEIRDKYFVFLYVYQSAGLYGHMWYNVSIDSLIVGLILIAIAQLKILNHKISNLKTGSQDFSISTEKEIIQLLKLRTCLKYFDFIIQYCSKLQEMFSPIFFVQFGVASITICFSLGLVVNSSREYLIFACIYLFVMTLEIFIPAYLGTVLSDESQKLMLAAYDCEWIPRSEPFKRNLQIFVERTKTPIALTGLSFFPISLETYTSIMKMAYSFFTLLRNVEFRQETRN